MISGLENTLVSDLNDFMSKPMISEIIKGNIYGGRKKAISLCKEIQVRRP